MVFIQSDVQHPNVTKEGTHKYAAGVQKSQRTEVILRNTKIEETGRCPFDVHTALIEYQCSFRITLDGDGRNRMSGVGPMENFSRGADLPQAYGCHLREFGELRFLQGPSRTSDWRKRKHSLAHQNIGRKVRSGTRYDNRARRR